MSHSEENSSTQFHSTAVVTHEGVLCTKRKYYLEIKCIRLNHSEESIFLQNILNCYRNQWKKGERIILMRELPKGIATVGVILDLNEGLGKTKKVLRGSCP